MRTIINKYNRLDGVLRSIQCKKYISLQYCYTLIIYLIIGHKHGSSQKCSLIEMVKYQISTT